MSFSEHEFLDWLRQRTLATGVLQPGVQLGIGDDAAVLQPELAGPFVLASDQTVEGVHFRRHEVPWPWIGRKALARSLSDLAAMAARPYAALVSVGIPDDVELTSVQQVFEGLLSCAQEEDTALVGGDTCRQPASLALDVTVFGCLEGRPPLCRSGACPGDDLWVSGELGGARGRHEFLFRPRWREAIALSATGVLHAALDLSDGLSMDLPRLCQASRVGAVVDLSALPLRTGANGRVSVEAALHEGEDFELLLAAPASGRQDLESVAASLQLPLTRMGRCTLEPSVLMDLGGGSVTPLRRDGYEHQLGDRPDQPV
jgi:thiamine-monophosphate kinase